MYHIQHYFALNKPYLLTVRQFSIFPNFKGLLVVKAKIIKDHKNKIKELTRDYQNEEERIKLFHEMDKERFWNEIISNKRFEKEIACFEKENEKEKACLEKEIKKEKADGLLEITRFEKKIEKEKADGLLKIARLKKEIEKVKADRCLEKIKTVNVVLDFFF